MINARENWDICFRLKLLLSKFDGRIWKLGTFSITDQLEILLFTINNQNASTITIYSQLSLKLPPSFQRFFHYSDRYTKSFFPYNKRNVIFASIKTSESRSIFQYNVHNNFEFFFNHFKT